MTDMDANRPPGRASSFLRQFIIQGSWNYRSMLGSGFAFCMIPLLRKRGLSGDALDDADLWHDLDGTAALMSALDLVISVPSTTVHLAGSVGAKVWVPFDSRWGCWWILKGARAPWYPSVRIFRCSAGGDWTSALAVLCDELSRLER